MHGRCDYSRWCNGLKFTSQTCVCGFACTHAYIHEMDFESLRMRDRGPRGWAVLLGVIKTRGQHK